MTDATADLSSEMVKKSTPIEFLPMQIQIGGNRYFYGLPDALTADPFYTLQKRGNYPYVQMPHCSFGQMGRIKFLA